MEKEIRIKLLDKILLGEIFFFFSFPPPKSLLVIIVTFLLNPYITLPILKLLWKLI